MSIAYLLRAWCVACCLAAVVLQSASGSAADVVRLRTGRVLIGTPEPSRSDAARLCVSEAGTQRLTYVSWLLLPSSVAQEIQRDWGWRSRLARPVEGVVLTRVHPDGSFRELRGALLGKADAKVLHVMVHGVTLAIPREQVRDLQDAAVDPLWVWPAKDLPATALARVRTTLAGSRPLTPADAIECAREALRGLESAVAIRYAAMGEGEAHAAEAQRIVRASRELATQPRTVAALRVAHGKVRDGALREARAAQQRLAAARAIAGPAIRTALRRFDAELELALSRLVQRRYVRAVVHLIQERVKSEGKDLARLLAWARDDLGEAAFKRLAVDLRREVGAVDALDLRLAWRRRERASYRSVPYGPGRVLSGRHTDAASAPLDVRAWWKRSEAEERAAFVLAWFATQGSVFESRTRESADGITVQYR